ncbi:MAG: glycosyltransferase [Phycisphaerae bacterium]
MDLSIVIPAYNESSKIQGDVTAAAAFLVGSGLTGEVLVVDDGSVDGTAAAAEAIDMPRGVQRRILRTSHRGKGHAVRVGMTRTRSRYAMLTDSGLCVPFTSALRGLQLLQAGACDIAHGSRKMPESIVWNGQAPHRRVLSRLFRAVIRTFLGIPRRLTDTQCGFKIYRGDVARELYSACWTDGFLFDVGIVMRALRKGYRILEFPIEWFPDPDSRVRLRRVLPETLRELMALRRWRHIEKTLSDAKHGRWHDGSYAA